MITHISHTLAQQIVNTIKDVCSYDINFINSSGTIIASTNSARIGAFHEIGRKAAVTGTTIEVAESDNCISKTITSRSPSCSADGFLFFP